MENINFRITDVTRIIERQNAVGWNVVDLYYQKEYAMVMVLDGETEYRIGGQTYLAQKNDLLLLSPKILRSGKTSLSNPWSFITIIFCMDLNEHARNIFNKSIHIWRNVNDTFRKLFQEIRRSWLSKDPLFEVKCNMLVTEILYRLVSSDLPYRNIRHIEKLEKARMVIQENFRNNISVEELAKSVSMSISYFRRLFFEAYGCSPMQYVINMRIENARDLLLSQEVNVTEAAQLSGFTDIYYFSRLFKRKTGIAPSALTK